MYFKLYRNRQKRVFEGQNKAVRSKQTQNEAVAVRKRGGGVFTLMLSWAQTV